MKICTKQLDRPALLSRTGVALLAGFGTLLILIALLGFGALKRTMDMSTQITAARDAFGASDKLLQSFTSRVQLTGILVRDYLIEPSPDAAEAFHEQLAQQRSEFARHIAALEDLGGLDRDKVDRLRAAAMQYALSLDPILNWTAEERLARSYWFTRRNLLPMRQAIVGLTGELQALNEQNLRLAEEARQTSRNNLRIFVNRLTWGCLLLGFIVAIASTWRVVALERAGNAARIRAEEAESEERRLAMRLVSAQEEERKRISLELHDAVGQMASALGLELGYLDSAHKLSHEEFQSKLGDVKRMNTEIVRAIKELARGLRPALLDDLGLGSALRSHARESSRRMGVPILIDFDGAEEQVTEPYKTCIYRVVQEALNNCARHANASRAIISMHASAGRVAVRIQDDGVGFDNAAGKRSGLGLLGIRERVRALDGVVRISSSPGQGTTLEIELPAAGALL